MDNETNQHEIIRELRAMADYIESRPFAEDSTFTSFFVYLLPIHAAAFGVAVSAAGSIKHSGNALNLIAKIRL